MCDSPVPADMMLAVFAGGLTAILLGMCMEPREVWLWRRRLARALRRFLESAWTHKVKDRK